jgi:hypothetical protein
MTPTKSSKAISASDRELSPQPPLDTINAPVSGGEGDCCVARPGDISNCDQVQRVGQMVMPFGIANLLMVIESKCQC